MRMNEDVKGSPNEAQDDAGVAAATAKQLNKLIEKVTVEGVGPMTGAIAWADDRVARARRQREKQHGDGGIPQGDPSQEDIERAIRRLIRESVEAAGVAGFATGLGGFVTMPVLIPMNMAGALVINARLAAAIAHLRGYDPMDPHVRTVVTMVAIGSSVQQVGRAVGIKVGERAAMQAVKKVPLAVIREINKKAGFSLVAKFGTKRSAITLAKGVPLVGGVVGGSVDATMTGLVGRTANRMFVEDHHQA